MAVYAITALEERNVDSEADGFGCLLGLKNFKRNFLIIYENFQFVVGLGSR